MARPATRAHTDRLLLAPLGVLTVAATVGCTSPRTHGSMGNQEPAPSVAPSEPDNGDNDSDGPALGPECVSDNDCQPYSKHHATWCSPSPEPVTTRTSPEAVIPGTLDGAPAQFGCRCVRGWCGALLNTGNLVVGPQADPAGVEFEDECRTDTECFPQDPAHGSWCGPTAHDFRGTVVEAVFVEGSLDGGTCLCLQGRCGARLNDGREVRGPQPPVYSGNGPLP